MFDKLKNISDMAGLLKNAGQFKEQLEQVKKQAKSIRVSAETGGGAVNATASGDMRIVSIKIDSAMMNTFVDPALEDDRQLAEDLIVGAVNAALEKAQQQTAHDMANKAREMGLPIPGDLDISDLLG